jgi:hypothetical protein
MGWKNGDMLKRFTAKKHTSGRKQRGAALKPGWWKDATDVVQIESLRRTNFQRIWKTFNKMAWEARPFLQNVQYDPLGRARHFLGAEVLTRIAEERKIDRKYQTTLKMPEAVEYLVSYARMDNVKDDKGVFRPDIHGEYEHTRLQQDKIHVHTQIVAAIPGLENSYQFDPRYISVLAASLDDKAWAVLAAKLTDWHIDEKQLFSLIKNIHATNQDVSRFKYHKPIFHMHATVDYNLFTVRMTAETDALNKFLLRIHRRMILVESTFPGSSFKLPLAEELFIELYRKPDEHTIGNPVCLEKSIVLTCSAVNGGGPFGVLPGASSLLHFFGQNAFTVDVADAGPSCKKNMKSSHNITAFMAGWLIRKLANIPNEFERLGPVFEALGTDPFLKGRAANLGVDRPDDPRTVLQNSFVNRQGAKHLLDVNGKKTFYVTLWLSTPTIAIIAISPLQDSRKANVFVWTMANNKDMVGAELPRALGGAAVAQRAPPSDTTDGTTMVCKMDSTPASMSRTRHGLFSRRIFEHRSTLPDDLERELQAL